MSVTRTTNRDQIEAVLEQLKHREIQVGFFADRAYPDGTPVAYVASIQELGYPAGGIPARPFMRPAAADNKGEWANQIAKGTRAALRGAIDLDSALSQVGALAASHVQDAIRAVNAPELAGSTIYNRRNRTGQNKNQSTKPLIDTAYMLQSVTYNVDNV